MHALCAIVQSRKYTVWLLHLLCPAQVLYDELKLDDKAGIKVPRTHAGNLKSTAEPVVGCNSCRVVQLKTTAKWYLLLCSRPVQNHTPGLFISLIERSVYRPIACDAYASCQLYQLTLKSTISPKCLQHDVPYNQPMNHTMAGMQQASKTLRTSGIEPVTAYHFDSQVVP